MANTQSITKHLTLILVSIIGVYFGIKAVTTSYMNKVDNYNYSQINSNDFITADERQRQLDCLTKNIYYEAAHESFEGKVAVAQVTLNRATHRDFPNDVCKVVYQKNVFYEKVVCQFSWYCEKKSRTKPISPELYAESAKVARKVLLENFRLDSVDKALYYHADYVNPGWKKVRVAKIGRHIFYR